VRRHGRLVHGHHVAFPAQDRARLPRARERRAEECPHALNEQPPRWGS
jgi:hypothetical protein